MSIYALFLVKLFTSLTLAVHILIGIALFFILTNPAIYKKVRLIITPYRALLFSIAIAIGGIIGSFLFSEIAGFPPCSLCYIQRYLLISALLILSIMLYLVHSHEITARILRYIFLCVLLPIITAGIFFGGYHTILQAFPNTNGTCLFGGAISCSKRYFYEFGYISLPTMSLTTFIVLFLAVLGIYKRPIA